MVDIRQQLSTQLFVGFNVDATNVAGGKDDSSDKCPERLLLHVRVTEDGGNMKKKDPSSPTETRYRYICLTVRKNSKIRLHKVKPGKTGGFSISKTWNLDDIKSVESVDDTQILVNVGKIYLWKLDDSQKKVEFLFTLLKLCRKYLKRQPKLTNVDEESLRAQMQLNSTFMSAAEKEFSNTFAAMAQRPRGVAFEEEGDVEEEDAVVAVPAEVDAPTVDLDEVLSNFNWHAGGDATALESRLITELQALEAANVHAIISSEDQANLVVNQLDESILQLDIIDEWISHYVQLLDGMGQDVHQIEVRHKGMQIASANQKLLLAELESILSSLRLPAYILDVLRTEPLNDPDGITQCEDATEKLTEVTQRKLDNDIATLQAVRDQIALLNGHGNHFAIRLHDYLVTFFQSQAEGYLQERTKSGKRGSLKVYGHEQVEEKIYQFCKLLKWLKGVDTRKHYNLQMAYVQEFARVYAREINEFLEITRTQHMQRKAEPDEHDYVFTSQAVSVGTAASYALKSALPFSKTSRDVLTPDKPRRLSNVIKRTSRGQGRRGDGGDHPVDSDSDDAGSIRSYRSHRPGPGHVAAASGSTQSLDDDRMKADEVVGYALSLLLPVMVREQNFMSDLFSLHKTDGSMTELEGSVAAPPPDPHAYHWQELLNAPRDPIKDLKLTKRMQELLEGLFDQVKESILSLIDNGLKPDQTYAIGMMVRTEGFATDYKNTSHTYVLAVLEDINRKLETVFDKFLDEQIKGIDDTKMTSKKRSGILPFVRTFPRFVDRMENHLNGNTGSAQRTVNGAYARIVQTILETLDTMAQQVAVDPKAAADDKEFLNIHILHVENMHHFYSEVRARKVPSLDASVKQAKSSYDVHLDAYCKVVMRRPLGKLWDFFEGIEGLLKTNTPEEINYHMQYNKGALKDVVRKYPGKEIKKGLDALYKRVEKHYTDEEGLLQVVWRGIQEEFTRRVRRYGDLIGICYPETSTHLEFTMEELLGYFSELARAH